MKKTAKKAPKRAPAKKKPAAEKLDRRGGHRPGAGRKPGAANRKTREIADRAISEGITPLEIMLLVMREQFQMGNSESALTAAKAAAPYIHPRLESIEHTGKAGEALHPKRLEIVFVRGGHSEAAEEEGEKEPEGPQVEW